MSRGVDERKKRTALRKLRKAASLAEQGLGPGLSDWERQFLEEVEARIETYGSAFADPEKGADGEALSSLQQVKLKEIDKKARGKSKSGFKSKARPAYTSRVRNIDAENEPQPKVKVTPASSPARPPAPRLVAAAAPPPPAHPPTTTPSPRPRFRVIEGGKSEGDA